MCAVFGVDCEGSLLTRVSDAPMRTTSATREAPFRECVTAIFENVRGGRRCTDHLIDHHGSESCDVELVVLIEPLLSGLSGIYMTAEEARNQASAAALRWLHDAGDRLSRAGLPHRGTVMIGRRSETLREVIQSRPDNRIVVAAPAFRLPERLFGRAYQRRLEKLAGRPVTILR